MVIIDMSGRNDPYTQEESEVDSSVLLITNFYEGLVDIYNTLNNNSDQISVGLTLTLFNFYF